MRTRSNRATVWLIRSGPNAYERMVGIFFARLSGLGLESYAIRERTYDHQTGKRS